MFWHAAGLKDWANILPCCRLKKRTYILPCCRLKKQNLRACDARSTTVESDPCMWKWVYFSFCSFHAQRCWHALPLCRNWQFHLVHVCQERVHLELSVRERNVEDNHRYDKITRVLEIRDVTKADSGVYGCDVVGLATCPSCGDNTQRTEVTINVYGKSRQHKGYCHCPW